MAGAQKLRNMPMLAGLLDYTDEGLIDDGGRAAGLADDQCASACSLVANFRSLGLPSSIKRSYPRAATGPGCPARLTGFWC